MFIATGGRQGSGIDILRRCLPSDTIIRRKGDRLGLGTRDIPSFLLPLLHSLAQIEDRVLTCNATSAFVCIVRGRVQVDLRKEQRLMILITILLLLVAILLMTIEKQNRGLLLRRRERVGQPEQRVTLPVVFDSYLAVG